MFVSPLDVFGNEKVLILLWLLKIICGFFYEAFKNNRSATIASLSSAAPTSGDSETKHNAD